MDTVLIVDDSVMLTNYLEESFEQYGDEFQTITAANGLEALEILETKAISLLVTDLEMPEMDGIALLTHKNQHFRHIPCIVMSAHGTPKLIETLQPDILQFIAKPFTAVELARAIISALKQADLC